MGKPTRIILVVAVCFGLLCCMYWKNKASLVIFDPSQKPWLSIAAGVFTFFTASVLSYILIKWDHQGQGQEYNYNERKPPFELKVALREKYIHYFSHVPKIPWIPGGEYISIDKIFVNLSLAEEGAHQYYTDEYCNIFTERKLRLNVYVISGSPGSGKTTLTQKLIYDWATGHDNFSKYEYVFLIKARELNDGETIAEYIDRIYIPDEEKGHISEIEELLGSETTLLVIDGLDELKKRDKDHEILRVIHRYKYTPVHVFVTTRPHVLKELVPLDGKTYHQFKILSFSDDDIIRYAQLYFGIQVTNITLKDIRNYTGLLNSRFVDSSYFEQFGVKEDVNIIESVFNLVNAIDEKSLWEIVSNPQCCLLVCFIWDHKKALPQKRTLLYKELFFILENTYSQVKKYHGLSWNEIMKGLGTIAFVKLLEEEEGNLTFNSSFLSQHISPKAGCLTGLIIEIGNVKAKSKIIEEHEILSPAVEWYQFVHKSIQEFCAAYFLGSLGDSDLVEALANLKSFIYKHKRVSTLFDLRLFLCGLSSVSEKYQVVGQQVMNIVENFLYEEETEYNQKCRDHENQLDCWQESFNDNIYYISIAKFKTIMSESSFKKTTISALNKIFKVLKSDNTMMLDSENLYLGNMKRPQKWELENEVVLDKHIQERKLAEKPLYFVKEIIGRTKSLKSLSLLFSNVDTGDVDYINEIPDDIQRFELIFWEISQETLKSLVMRLPQWKNLKEFRLAYTGTHFPNEISQLMPSSLTEYEIRNQYLTAANILALILNIPRLERLEQIYVINDNEENEDEMADDFLEEIENTLERYQGKSVALKKVQLISEMNVLPGMVFIALSRVLMFTLQLNELDLTGTVIGENGVLLADNIPSSIVKLWLGSCRLSIDSIAACVANLPRWTKLKDLALPHNQQTMDIDAQVHTSVPHVIPLESLHMSLCNAKPNLISYLTSQLNAADRLIDVDLSDNDIQYAGESLVCSLSDSVRILKLNGCHLNVNSIDVILKQLFKLRNLTFIDLSDNLLFEEYPLVDTEKIINGKDVPLKIENFIFKNSNIMVGNWPLLSSVIEACMFLTELDLSGNDLSQMKQVQLFDAISPAIEKISFSSCKISDGEFILLVNNLQRWPRLKFFDISNNNITSSQCTFAASLPRKTKELRIHNNQFVEAEILDVINYLPVYHKLEIIHIDMLPSHNTAFRTLCGILRTCKHVQEYQFYGLNQEMKDVIHDTHHE